MSHFSCAVVQKPRSCSAASVPTPSASCLLSGEKVLNVTCMLPAAISMTHQMVARDHSLQGIPFDGSTCFVLFTESVLKCRCGTSKRACSCTLLLITVCAKLSFVSSMSTAIPFLLLRVLFKQIWHVALMFQRGSPSINCSQTTVPSPHPLIQER